MKPADRSLIDVADDWSDTTKELKRQHKRERDLVRSIDGWEQYRMLWDGIEFKREIINMGDKKARFALAIVGALNAALLVMLTRAPVLQLMTVGVREVLAVLLVIYGTVTFGFVIHTIEAIRPRGPEARKFDAAVPSRSFCSTARRRSC